MEACSSNFNHYIQLQALLSCPTSSIHTERPTNKILEVQKMFPLPIDEQNIPVCCCFDFLVICLINALILCCNVIWISGAKFKCETFVVIFLYKSSLQPTKSAKMGATLYLAWYCQKLAQYLLPFNNSKSRLKPRTFVCIFDSVMK